MARRLMIMMAGEGLILMLIDWCLKHVQAELFSRQDTLEESLSLTAVAVVLEFSEFINSESVPGLEVANE